ncbi:MAG: hypothetical protein KY410_11005 [Proteobacteria bacterium]|nr:hypothetical protein [Pseudomonadota bacterium]
MRATALELAQDAPRAHARTVLVHRLHAHVPGRIAGRPDDLGKKLLGIYAKSQSDEEKRAIVQAMAMHGESEALIGLYQEEQDPKIRRDILQSMALFMNDERVGDFFEEFLKED